MSFGETLDRLAESYASNLVFARFLRPAAEAEIAEAEEALLSTFSPNYRAFLQRFGKGGFVGKRFINGVIVSDDEIQPSGVVNITKFYRESGMPNTDRGHVISEDDFGNPIIEMPDLRLVTFDHDFWEISDERESFADFLAGLMS